MTIQIFHLSQRNVNFQTSKYSLKKPQSQITLQAIWKPGTIQELNQALDVLKAH